MKLRVQSSELRVEKPINSLGSLLSTVYCLLFAIFILITCHLALVTAAAAAEWGGVDESVVEKYAEEHGRTARDPVINTDQGDLLLFVFLLGGAVGGFAAGYYWRELMERRPEKSGGTSCHRPLEE